MPRRGATIVVIGLAVILGACQAVTPMPSVGPASVVPTSGTASASPPGSGVAPVIDPAWVTRPALTCGEPGQRFPPEALLGPGLAELGLDPAAGVLRSIIAEAPPETPFPATGWHRVSDGPGGVVFVARGAGDTPWWAVEVGVLEGTLQAKGFGECHLAIVAPNGVSFARWWLDPDGPPITPDTTRIAILLREHECASGEPPVGRVLTPTLVTTPDGFLVAVPIRRQLTGQDCPGNPAFPFELILPEAIGSRDLFDASQFPPRPVTADDPG
jgi:hypothetical protein